MRQFFTCSIFNLTNSLSCTWPQMHDADSNNFLDGNELLKMFIHDDHDIDEDLVRQMVIHTLEEDDVNNVCALRESYWVPCSLESGKRRNICYMC